MSTPRPSNGQAVPEHVVVVGAGMIGLATAWFLQRHGVQVSVVDRIGPAAGSSWGNAGWLAPALTLPLPEPAILKAGILETLRPDSPVYVPLRPDPHLLRFLVGFARHCTPRKWERAIAVFNQANAESLAAFAQLTDPAAEHPVAEPTKPAEPFLAVFRTESDRGVLVDEFEHVATAGGTIHFELLDRAALEEAEPALADGVRYGVRLHDQRFINPGRFVNALGEAVVAAGGQIITGREVLAIRQQGGVVRVDCAHSASLTGDAVVIANGAWLSRLARPHGVRRFVQAGRGYSFTVHPDHAPTGPVYLPAQRIACTPLGDPADGLRIAGMMEFQRPEAPLDPRRIEAIVKAAAPMLRGVDWSARHDEWVGSRPCTADGLPLVGRTRSERVFVAGGHGMWGIALGPLTGRLLADQITGTAYDPLLDAFNPLR